MVHHRGKKSRKDRRRNERKKNIIFKQQSNFVFFFKFMSFDTFELRNSLPSLRFLRFEKILFSSFISIHFHEIKSTHSLHTIQSSHSTHTLVRFEREVDSVKKHWNCRNQIGSSIDKSKRKNEKKVHSLQVLKTGEKVWNQKKKI